MKAAGRLQLSQTLHEDNRIWGICVTIRGRRQTFQFSLNCDYNGGYVVNPSGPAFDGVEQRLAIMRQEVRKDHLVNQVVECGAFSGYERDDGLTDYS